MTIDPIVPGGAGIYAQIAAKTNSPRQHGEILRFTKDGRWLYGIDKIEPPHDTRFIASLADMQLGFVRWQNGRPQEHVLVGASSGLPLPRRSDLSHTAREQWDEDAMSGRRRDPWQEIRIMPLYDPSTSKFLTFSTSSRGGFDATNSLLRDYDQNLRLQPGHDPLVELGSDSYQHPQRELGKVFIPLLRIVGWAPRSIIRAAMAERGFVAATPLLPPGVERPALVADAR